MHGNLDVDVRYVDATDRFLAALSGVIDAKTEAADRGAGS